jgi:putative FmdB family regulatory protein
MPIFEYICEECSCAFEAIVNGGQDAKCPKCEGGKLSQQLSVFAVSSKSGMGSASDTNSVSPCGSCGDARGPGACSMRD